jgi:hypothetical protein
MGRRSSARGLEVCASFFPLSSLLFLLSLSVQGETCVPLEINTTSPHHTVGRYFASWTVDPSRNRLFFDVNFTDPRLLYLARSIGGGSGLIRFGGGGADELTYGGYGGLPPCDSPQPWQYECLNKSTLDSLIALSRYSGNKLIFGLNIVPLGGPLPAPPLRPGTPPPRGGFSPTCATRRLPCLAWSWAMSATTTASPQNSSLPALTPSVIC